MSRPFRTPRIVQRFIDRGNQSLRSERATRDWARASTRPVDPLAPEELVAKEGYGDRRFPRPGGLGRRPGAAMVDNRVHSAEEPVQRNVPDGEASRR